MGWGHAVALCVVGAWGFALHGHGRHLVYARIGAWACDCCVCVCVCAQNTPPSATTYEAHSKAQTLGWRL
jgi:hypothetical protein